MLCLQACDILLKLGYSNVAWLDGGFQVVPSGCFERGSLQVEGSAEGLQYGGIGGLSQVLKLYIYIKKKNSSLESNQIEYPHKRTEEDSHGSCWDCFFWGSQVVGWTDIQRSQPGGRIRSLIAAGLAFAIIDIIVFKALGN